MKLLSTLTVAALMSAGSAFAASTPTATAGATATPATVPAKHEGMHCAKEARERKLTGDAEKAFIKECRAGKKAN
jgi:hypothetical protein